MQLIIDTLEAARRTASPSAAMDLADAIADLRRIDRSLDDIAIAVEAFDALRAHVECSPFTAHHDDLLAPAAVEWLAVLERIAS